MTDPSIIFQRTHTGREEIHQKSHGLTQSERLVLIMVDGVSTYSQIRAKLPVLTDERFERALQKLQLKELVLEVFMPLEGQTPDELEKTVIDRFLQQDPMDPVTIMLRDPEEELGMLTVSPRETSPMSPFPPVMPSIPTQDAPQAAAAPVAVAEPIKPPPQSAEPAMDAHHVQLADLLAEEVRAKRAARPVSPPQRIEPVQAMPTPTVERPEPSPFAAVHWGYWLIVSGLSFILGFFLAKITG